MLDALYLGIGVDVQILVEEGHLQEALSYPTFRSLIDEGSGIC